MQKRGSIYRNKYLDARRYLVRKMTLAAGLQPPYDSINLKDEKVIRILQPIAKHFQVSLSCIKTSLIKEKAIPSKKLDFNEEYAYWITNSEISSSDIEAARIEKAKELLKAGWRVNAVEEYLDLSKYNLYKIRDAIKKDTENTTEALEELNEKREGEIFELWKKGLSQTDIANSLGITRQTVNSDLKKYKVAYIHSRGEEEWEKLESHHNAKCAEGKDTKKQDYDNKAQHGKKEIQNKINEDGSLTASIAEIEKELELNTKTVQKFVLLTLLERNLTERAVEFAIGIVGQPEIIKLSLKEFPLENKNESYYAVKYVLEKHKKLSNQKKKSKNIKLLVKKVLKEIQQKP